MQLIPKVVKYLTPDKLSKGMTRIDELVGEHLRWGMHFTPELEREYRVHHAQRSVAPQRVGLIIIFFLLIGASMPWLADPNMRRLNSIICLGVLAPAVLFIIGGSFSPKFPRWSQGLMSLLAMLITGGFLLVQHVGPEDFYQRQSAIPTLFVIFGVFTIARQRFWNAMFTSMAVAAMNLFWIYSVRPLPLEIQTEKTVYLGFAFVLGLAAAYPTDRVLRRDFLLGRLLLEEKERSDTLLTNILPEPISQKLKKRWGVIADSHPDVTVLFADVVDFTPFSAAYPPDRVLGYLNGIFSRFDALVEEHGLEKIKTVGDAYMVAGGLNSPSVDPLRSMALLALNMQAVMAETPSPSGTPMDLRIGIHAGPLVAGVIGSSRLMYDVWGDTVNIASRMESQGLGGRIQVTQEVKDRLESEFEFQERGRVEVKGKGKLKTFWLVGRRQPVAEDQPQANAVAS